MRHIFLNLKRFDIPAIMGGVNRSNPGDWAGDIIKNTKGISRYQDTEFAAFFPEAHIINARFAAVTCSSPMQVGCQSVFREDVEPGKNFGAFTSNRTAKSMKALGADYTIIGHCEERKDKLGIMAEAGAENKNAVNRILNKEIKCAINSGLKVLYCIGESADEQDIRYKVLEEQLAVGLTDVNISQVVIAYEPVWAIGPGKIPPDAAYITEIARFIKRKYDDIPVVYGGGLKSDNAKMLAGIKEINGGLIALTRFSGEIGFYVDEYLEIVKLYFS
jgi:triosephosphate isomerase (TIM)